MVENKVQLYLVAYVRDGGIESVVQVTRSLRLAQSVLLSELGKCDPEEAKLVLKDFSDGTLTDNVRILLNNDELGPLSIQLVSWEQNL
jgi:hypothetical protein